MNTSPKLIHEQIWKKYDAMELRLTAPVSERMLELAKLRPGMKVLDLATGRGEPAIRAAHKVGPNGTVIGVDLSAGLLRMAQDRAESEGLSNLQLKVANAENLGGIPTDHFDIALARWGLMYFDSPVAALKETHRVLKPDGLLIAAFWAEPERVPYVTLPRKALQPFAPVPSIDLEVPGTFRFADPHVIERDLSASGFFIEQIEEIEIPVMEASTPQELIEWTRVFGMNRLLNGLPLEIQKSWETELVQTVEPFRKDGLVRLGGITRIVKARAKTPI